MFGETFHTIMVLLPFTYFQIAFNELTTLAYQPEIMESENDRQFLSFNNLDEGH
jgi:hypothetical protein